MAILDATNTTNIARMDILSEMCAELARLEARRESYERQAAEDLVSRDAVASRLLAAITSEDPQAAAVLGVSVSDVLLVRDPDTGQVVSMVTDADAKALRNAP